MKASLRLLALVFVVGVAAECSPRSTQSRGDGGAPADSARQAAAQFGWVVDTVDVLGVIQQVGSLPAIVVPDTVASNSVFRVQVTTAGGGCVLMGTVEVEHRADTALLVPVDREIVWTRVPDYVPKPGDPDGGVCFDVLVEYVHEVELRSLDPGILTVAVSGLRKTLADPRAKVQTDTITVTREVTVK